MDPNQQNEPYQPNNVNYYDIPPNQGDTSGTSYKQGDVGGESYNQGDTSSASYNQGNTYGTSYGQENQYDPYGQRSGSFNLNGQNYSYENNGYQGNGYQNGAYSSNPYSNGSYQTGRADQGKKPNFVLYFVFSVIEIFFSTIFGVISLILSIVANSQYNQGDTQGAKGKLLVARILLIIGLVINLLFFGVIAAFVAIQQIDTSNHSSSYALDIDDDDDEKVGENPDAKMGELSSKWTDFKVALDGQVYSFPCKMSELTDNGWVIDDDYAEDTVEGGNYMMVICEKGDYQISVYAVNNAKKEKNVSECLVGGLSVDGYYVNEGLSFSICQGVSIGTSQENAKKILGEPDYEYEGEANDFWDDYRTWSYYVNDDTYQGLNITLIDHEITSISIENLYEE